MCAFYQTPNEILIQIVNLIPDVSSICRLAGTSWRLHEVANPILYCGAFRSRTALAWAVRHDRPDIIHRAIIYQIHSPQANLCPDMNISLHEALRNGSFRAANALLDLGADIVYSSDCCRRSACRDTNAWLSKRCSSSLGSLALGAQRRYHMLLWYNTQCTYLTEVEFWEWKKLVMAKVLRRLEANLSVNSWADASETPLAEYQREVDYALIEAASADAHATEMMDHLLKAGANVDLETNSHIVGQTWSNALSEEVPNLFKSKVDFLIDHGVNVDRLWLWESVYTPVEFFLTKLHRSCPFTSEPSFISRIPECADFLESRGCLRWPCIAFADANGGEQNDWGTSTADDAEPGMRELANIFADTDRRLLPLQKRLHERVSECAVSNATSRAPERKPEPCSVITRLNTLYEAWVAGRLQA
ncbi:hypothetical protein K456DRAFT_43982 [Colletotrichum gloeosporioides 23]|nr:hypothetical protein K456DRAFT_43982 [Colletotrichum gloeosporioides 23]